MVSTLPFAEPATITSLALTFALAFPPAPMVRRPPTSICPSQSPFRWTWATLNLTG